METIAETEMIAETKTREKISANEGWLGLGFSRRRARTSEMGARVKERALRRSQGA
jgi:hypothetical protein